MASTNPDRRMRRVVQKTSRTLPGQIKKGQLLAVKSPPYYKNEYIYEVKSAGAKLVRAVLYHSPTVRRSWTQEELSILMELGIIRLVAATGL